MCKSWLYKILHMALLQYLGDKYSLCEPNISWPHSCSSLQAGSAVGALWSPDCRSYWQPLPSRRRSACQQQKQLAETWQGSGFQKWGPSVCSEVSSSANCPFDSPGLHWLVTARKLTVTMSVKVLLIQQPSADAAGAPSAHLGPRCLHWGLQYRPKSAGYSDPIDIKTA